MNKLIRSILPTLFLFHSATADTECAPITTVPNFDLNEFVRARWYVHQQAPTKYVPVERNFCSYAEYDIIDGRPTFPWGYTVKVHNYAQDATGKSYGGELCAYQESANNTPAKLGVAPCNLPKAISGPYWVLAYDETDGYALISGGQPTIFTGEGCRLKQGLIESGLWVFLRSRDRKEETVAKVRKLAQEQFGFDVSVLNDVDQTHCEETSLTVEELLKASE